ncbi:hypothetical protein VNO77_33076 [Canavalia gladiata]|uniref:Uncharacterized protein n=1 Tax=Canavalia gladiata TaxID=3824 RepID=A0AAN9KBP6_CANGL
MRRKRKKKKTTGDEPKSEKDGFSSSEVLICQELESYAQVFIVILIYGQGPRRMSILEMKLCKDGLVLPSLSLQMDWFFQFRRFEDDRSSKDASWFSRRPYPYEVHEQAKV